MKDEGREAPFLLTLIRAKGTGTFPRDRLPFEMRCFRASSASSNRPSKRIAKNGMPEVQRDPDGPIYKAIDADQSVATEEFWRVLRSAAKSLGE